MTVQWWILSPKTYQKFHVHIRLFCMAFPAYSETPSVSEDPKGIIFTTIISWVRRDETFKFLP